MKRIVTIESEILTTDRWCGDHVCHVPCPQMGSARFGFELHCRLFHSNDRDITTRLWDDYDDMLKVCRCDQCLKYFNESYVDEYIPKRVPLTYILDGDPNKVVSFES